MISMSMHMQEAVRITVRCEVQKSLLNTAHCTPQHPQQPVSTGYSCKNATVTGNHHNALRDRSVGSENFMHTAGYDGVLQRGGGLWAWFTAQFYVCFPLPSFSYSPISLANNRGMPVPRFTNSAVSHGSYVSAVFLEGSKAFLCPPLV